MSLRGAVIRGGEEPDLGIRASIISRAQFDEVFEACKNWGRWGADDEVGTLNFISPNDVRGAAKLVRSGVAITCSWPLDTRPGPDNPRPAVHYMTQTFGAPIAKSGDVRFLRDYMGVECHGDAHSHVDALCHVSYEDKLYNGLGAQETVADDGPTCLSVDAMCSGIISRGVLLDIPRVQRSRWVEPGSAVGVEELLAAEELQHVRLRTGDILLLRTGHARRRLELGPWDSAKSKAGLSVTAMPLLHERKVAAVGFDGDGEAIPSPCDGISHPIHAIGIGAMGLCFFDSLFLEELAAACEAEGRWEFFFVVAPLRIVGGTGSPVNPIAVL